MRKWPWGAIALAVILIIALIPIARFLIVRVPDAVGGNFYETRGRFDGSGVRVVLVDPEGEVVSEPDWIYYDEVIDQEPGPGALLVRGMTMTLHVEHDKRPTAVPYLIGLFAGDAEVAAEEAGFAVEHENSSGLHEAAIVVSQTPSANVEVPGGTTITVEAHFPHRPNDHVVDSVRDVHGIFYLRNGLEGAANCVACHSPATCDGGACHKGPAYEELSRAFPPPRIGRRP